MKGPHLVTHAGSPQARPQVATASVLRFTTSPLGIPPVLTSQVGP